MSANSALFKTTIYALSSGGLPSGVAIIRISGSGVQDALRLLIGEIPLPRQALFRRIRNERGETLDRGLVLFFQGPHSFTGEDCVELHLHGSRAVVAAVLALLGSLPGFRLAEAGEFTRRAFINGKMDLTEAEALSDLVAAETEIQRRLAMQNADGSQRDLYNGWSRRLLQARALIEAELDFADEADVPGSVSDQVWSDMAALIEEIESHLTGFHASEIIREGFRVVLVGAPNAGKSSLLNALAQRDVAIVTDIPGTTRDLVEVALDIEGFKVIVTDTAGLRATEDVVERIGVERAIGAVKGADLILSLTEPGGNPADLTPTPSAPVVLVRTKCDVASPLAGAQIEISSATGQGIADLLYLIGDHARKAVNVGETTIPSRLRHKELLSVAGDHIGMAVMGTGRDLELRAEELRLAAISLGRITGKTDVEELLDVIFSEFCIGK